MVTYVLRVSLWSVARWLEFGAFTVLGVVAVVQWRRRSGKAAARLAQAFALLGAYVVLQRFVPVDATDGPALWARKVLIVVLALFPFCLYRFTGAFSPSPRRSDLLAGAATVALVAATLCIPSLPRGPEPLPLWAVLYRVVFVAQWTVLSAMAATRLWRSGRAQPTVIRRRMRTLGAAAAVLNLAVLMAGSSTTPEAGIFAVAARVLGLVATVLFVLGFAPPSVLRVLWRRREVAAFRRAETDLMAAATTERIAEIVLPHAAELAGAQAAVLFDANGSALAQHRMSDDEVATLAQRLATYGRADGPPVVTPGLVALRLRGGWMAMTTSESTPFFGSGELELLESLAHFAGLALERAELSERQRDGQLALAEREAQLAEAQQTAHLGSYRWDLRTHAVVWSDEMYRVLGFEPGDPGARRTFQDRVHPEDRERIAASREAIATQTETSSDEYRIVLPSGEVRWIEGRLRPTVEDGVTVAVSGTLQDITEAKLAEEVISFQARHDFLTQLPVRALFMDRLATALSRRQSDGGSVAVLLFDVDRFKWLNDSLGHAAGDRLLIEFAARLRSVVRPQDMVARFGGDEFVVLCENVEPDDAKRLAERMSSSLTSPVDVGGEGGETTLTVSIGIALASIDDDEATPESLVGDADTAMYRAKEVGRNCIQIFDLATRLVAFARHETANALRQGIDREELVVHFQPEVDLTTGRAVGVEALVRWNHPQRGLVPPAEFITIAEETGLIVPLGAAVLREACSVMAGWQRFHADRAGMNVSVNLSARQLLAPNLADVVGDALASSGLAPESLCLEITESVLLEDSDACARALARLSSFGVRIGVDDFGTGFSSLTYLKRFPVDILKIDKSFVDGLGQSREDRAIVASIIDLAHAFGLTTIAEGVETPEQLAELKNLGCELGQGYLWSRPLPAAEADEWISSASALLPPEIERSAPRRGRRCAHRVLLVDDDHRMRKLLRLVLDDEGGDEDVFEVVAETEDGREAVGLARHHHPDIVLLDLAMPGMGGLEALPLILAVAPDAKVVVFSGLDSEAFVAAAKRQGAAAFIPKGSDPNDLSRILRPLLSASSSGRR